MLRILAFVGVVALTSAPPTWAIPVFTTLTGPNFAERLPGPDGLLGTADDVSAPGVNLSGTATFVEFLDVSATAGTNFHSFSSGTFDIQEPLVLQGTTVTIETFDVATVNEQTNGFATTSVDLKTSPHGLVYEFPGDLLTEYTLESCITTNPTYCLEADLVLSGFTLLRGFDPSLLPGIAPELASYLDLLTTVAPADWTALTITVSAATAMTSANTRGTLAPFFIGGTASGVTALVTSDPIEVVPEPTTSLLVASGLVGLAVGRRR